jgi:hypothetical protein
MLTVEADPNDQQLFSLVPYEGGQRRRSGPPVTTGSRLRTPQLSHGPLIGAHSVGRLWLVPATGDLLQLDTTGTLHQRFTIPGFIQGLIEEGPGTISMALVALDRGTSGLIGSMTALDPGIGALQLRTYRTMPGGLEPIAGEFPTTLFDLRSGRLVGTRRDLPRILAADGGLLVLTEGDDEPSVRLVGYRLQATGQ